MPLYVGLIAFAVATAFVPIEKYTLKLLTSIAILMLGMQIRIDGHLAKMVTLEQQPQALDLDVHVPAANVDSQNIKPMVMEIIREYEREKQQQREPIEGGYR